MARHQGKSARNSDKKASSKKGAGQKKKLANQKPGRKRRSKPPAPKRKGRKTMPDPSDHPDATTRFVPSHEAVKVYLCPGCNRDIVPGQSHLVAVPPDDPDLRRHWHRGCWDQRLSTR